MDPFPHKDDIYLHNAYFSGKKDFANFYFLIDKEHVLQGNVGTPVLPKKENFVS